MFDVERARAGVSGGEIAFLDLGEGPPVLLLHGYPTSSVLWRREASLLAQRMRVIVPDLMGYGQSDKPADGDVTEPAQAEYLRELLTHLGISELALVGHDIGGAICQMLALDDGPVIRALVLLDTACFDAWPVESIRLVQGAGPEQETGEFVENIVRGAFALGVRHQELLDPVSVEAYVRPWREDPKAFFRATRGLSGKGLAGREPELERLDVPAFLIWGEDDPFLPAALGERLQSHLPGATLALLPGCSHFVTEDAPGTVGPLIYEYLRSRYLRESHSHPGPAGPVSVFMQRPPEGFVDGPEED